MTITITLLILGAWWVLVPLLAAIPGAVYGLYQDDPWVMVFSFIHPYFNLGIMTESLFSARGTGWYGQWSWICDCLLMLFASLGMVSFAAYRVRAVGLSLMGGEAPVRKKSSKGKGIKIAKSIGKSRPLLGCPILWKELRTPLFGKRPILVKVLMCGAIGLMAILYLAMAHGNDFDDVDLQNCIILTLVGMPCLFAMIMSATTVTTEREARSWPVLLVTTIGHGQILRGKWLGIVRRVLPAWALLVGHLVIYTLFGVLSFWASLHIMVVCLGLIVYVTGCGLFFSALCKRTTSAVVFSVMTPLVIWSLLPLLFWIIGHVLYRSDTLAEACFELNPYLPNLRTRFGRATRSRLFFV